MERKLVSVYSLYANHEKYHTTMTKDQLKGLNVFLMSPARKEENLKANYWSLIVQDWVNRNGGHYFEHIDDYQSIKKPDYTNIQGCVDMGKKYKEK